MEVADAFTLISRAIDSGHTAHGYLVCGDRHCCEELVSKVLAKLFPNAAEQVAAGSHPDIIRLAPSGASHTIKVAKSSSDPTLGIRDGMIEPVLTTSFSGGWKVGIIEGADRFQAAAANAFLKTLEEPPAKTLFLLLTDTPDAIMPTIISRTQRVDLPLSEGLLTGSAYEQIAELFNAEVANGVYEKSMMAKRLAEILGEIKEEAKDSEEDVGAVRKSFFRTIMSFARKWMTEGRIANYRAFNNINAIEEAYRQSDRSLNDEMVLSFMMDRMVFP